jgi:hypothetical protein
MHDPAADLQVIKQVIGKEQAPWEAAITAPVIFDKLGHFKPAVLSLLQRTPLDRPSMAEFELACSRVLQSTITENAA